MAAQLQQSQAAATTGVHEIEAEDTFQVKENFHANNTLDPVHRTLSFCKTMGSMLPTSRS